MNEVHAEVSRLITIGAAHDPSLPSYKEPRLEEWFNNTEHIHKRLEAVAAESLGKNLLTTSAEFTERHNGTLAVWARLQAAEVELVDLLHARRGQSAPALARISLDDLRSAMNVNFIVAENSIKRDLAAHT